MPSPESDLIKSLVSERLKHVDGLVRAQKIDEAIKEIGEVRKLDSTNPYALAYEERIKALQQKLKSESTHTPPPAETTEQRKDSPPSPGKYEQTLPTTVDSAPGGTADLDSHSIPAGTPASQIRDSSADTSTGVQKKSKGKGSIILIDDDVLLIQALSEFLEDSRYSTKSFTRADDALEYLKENSPDLVICDVNLETSTFGGFTLHEKMRKFEHLRDVPFIFLSGLNDTAIVLAGKELGADDYLTKPVEPEALLAVVKGKLKRYRQIKKNA